jgi:hypothetical protein
VASRRRTRFAHVPDKLDELRLRRPFGHLLKHVLHTPKRIRDIACPVVACLTVSTRPLASPSTRAQQTGSCADVHVLPGPDSIMSGSGACGDVKGGEGTHLQPASSPCILTHVLPISASRRIVPVASRALSRRRERSATYANVARMMWVVLERDENEQLHQCDIARTD